MALLLAYDVAPVPYLIYEIPLFPSFLLLHAKLSENPCGFRDIKGFFLWHIITTTKTKPGNKLGRINLFGFRRDWWQFLRHLQHHRRIQREQKRDRALWHVLRAQIGHQDLWNTKWVFWGSTQFENCQGGCALSKSGDFWLNCFRDICFALWCGVWKRHYFQLNWVLNQSIRSR